MTTVSYHESILNGDTMITLRVNTGNRGVSMTDGLAELEKRVVELSARVDALNRKLNEVYEEIYGGPAADGGADLAGLDRFDRHVVEKAEAFDGEPTPRTYKAWFEDAGVRDSSKVRDRVNSLKRRGYLD